MLTGEFMVKRINAMTSDLEQIVDDLIDKMFAKGGEADIVTDLAYPYPTRVIMKLLGLPEADIKFVSAKTTDRTRSDGQAAKTALEDLITYMREQTVHKMQNLDKSNDLMTRVLSTFVVPGEIDIEDAVQMFELVAVGGHETTANMTALGVLALLENPNQADLLRKQPDLMPGAVNEMLRYISIAQHLGGRVCVRDKEIGGKMIKAGEGVYALLHMANWDEHAFACPSHLDVTRNPTNHLAFSFGAHQCLGMNLARLELQIVYRKVLERLPNMKLAKPVEDLVFNHDTTNFGIRSLPVTL
jgi:cytochrome P450